MKKNKKISLGVLALLSVTFGIGGVATLSATQTNLASASSATANVDLLGNFTWNKVEGAAGYEVSYAVNGQTYTFNAEKNEANVGVALTRAAQSAVALNSDSDDTNDVTSASVTFSVTPTGVSGTAAEYVHTFSSYIDYGYKTHDFADVKAQAKHPTKISELVMDGCIANFVPSAMFKNDLLTIGMRADAELGTDGIDFALFGTYANDTKRDAYNYRIMTRSDGKVFIGITCAYNKPWYEENIVTPAMTTGENYYLAMGVFDTYDLTGAVSGETVYYSRSEYNASTDSLDRLGSCAVFVSNETLTAEGVSYKNSYKIRSACDQSIEVEKSGMYIYAKGVNDKTYVFSGIPNYRGLDQPTGLYYDNSDASFKWNEVEGATEYEWRVDNGEWTKTHLRTADVSALLADGSQYRTLGYLPFSVRAVGGKEAHYYLDLHRFYNIRSTVMDYVDILRGGTPASSKSVVNLPKGVTNTYNPSGYTYKNTPLKMGVHVTMKMKILATASYSQSVMYIGLYGPNAFDYDSRYYLCIFGDGTFQLGNTTVRWNTNASDRPKSKYWRMTNLVDGFGLGEIYYVTYGIDDVYENDVKVAERVTVRLDKEVDGGLNRETVGVISFDNEKFATEGYIIANNPSVQTKQTQTYADIFLAKSDTNHTITFTAGEETVATKTVDFGSWYDFSDVGAISEQDGYKVEGWYYKNAKGKEKEFPLSGIMNAPILNEIQVYAKLAPITYNVSYGVASNNPTKYTTESAWTLEKPAVIPVGKVFDAWYDANDTAREHPLTTLEGKTGDITLIANFVDGHSVTVQIGDTTQVVDYKASDASITLSAPDIQDKTFVKWTKLEDGEYVDYTNEQTFACKPTGAHTFKAVYAWTEYKVEYVADGGMHGNAGVYTANKGITFEPAKKDGHFFLGWYADETFTTKIAETNAAGDMKVYAKFVEHGLTEKVELERSAIKQELPAPKLSDGASYTVALSLNGENVEVKNNAYAFDKVGDYELTYTVTLASGEACSYTVAYTVEGAYTVNVHSANETVTLKKNGGETLAESEIPATPEGYEFGGLYTDSEYKNAYDKTKAVEEDMNIYVKWIPVVQSEPVKETAVNPIAIVLGALGGIVLGGGLVAGYAFLQKKKRDE